MCNYVATLFFYLYRIFYCEGKFKKSSVAISNHPLLLKIIAIGSFWGVYWSTIELAIIFYTTANLFRVAVFSVNCRVLISHQNFFDRKILISVVGAFSPFTMMGTTDCRAVDLQLKTYKWDFTAVRETEVAVSIPTVARFLSGRFKYSLTRAFFESNKQGFSDKK